MTDQTKRREEWEAMRAPVILAPTAYPKMLYKGGYYDDFKQMTLDIQNKVIQCVVVGNETEEKDVRNDGFCDLANLMDKPKTVVQIPKKRGRPKKVVSGNPA